MQERRLEIHLLQDCLKQLIQSRGLRLADVAKELGLSIATAKRLLNADDLSMERILELCDQLGIHFYDLVEMTKRQRMEYHFCSLEQEEFLATHPAHFGFLRALQRGESLAYISKTARISKADGDAYLADLESHKFLTYHTDTSIDLHIPAGMDWRPGGALWKAYYATWMDNFTSHMQGKETQDDVTLIEMSQRLFTKSTILDLKREIDDLSRKYASISKLERKVHPRDRLQTFTCLIAGDIWKSTLWDIKPYGSK